MKVNPRVTPPRDDRYMGEAFFKTKFSKDPSTRMGAVIVSSENEPLGSGYNGPSSEINDEEITFGREEYMGLNKYDVMIHAEKNAIRFAQRKQHKLNGATIYVTGMPCNACMEDIILAGIKRVVYYPHVSKDKKSMFQNDTIFNKTCALAKRANVSLEEFKGDLTWMQEHIADLNDLGIFLSRP